MNNEFKKLVEDLANSIKEVSTSAKETIEELAIEQQGEAIKEALKEGNPFLDFLEGALEGNTQEDQNTADIEEQEGCIFTQESDGNFKVYGDLDTFLEQMMREDSKRDSEICSGGIILDDNLFNNTAYGPLPETNVQVNFMPTNEEVRIDSHYDFEYAIDDEDLQRGSIKIDPYLVCEMWDLGRKDPTGCLFHMLKNIARLGTKAGNTTQREVNGLYATLARFCELNGLTKG